MVGKSLNVGDKNDHKAGKKTARSNSPSPKKRDSVQQFQFRVLCVRDKTDNDISQKKKQNDNLYLEHKKYGDSADCYL